MVNWKAAGSDHVQGYWFKRMTHLHPSLQNFLLEGVQFGIVPDRMTKGRAVLKQKGLGKGTQTSKYSLIAYLPIMWKLLTGIIGEESAGNITALINNSLTNWETY